MLHLDVLVILFCSPSLFLLPMTVRSVWYWLFDSPFSRSDVQAASLTDWKCSSLSSISRLSPGMSHLFNWLAVFPLLDRPASAKVSLPHSLHFHPSKPLEGLLTMANSTPLVNASACWTQRWIDAGSGLYMETGWSHSDCLTGHLEALGNFTVTCCRGSEWSGLQLHYSSTLNHLNYYRITQPFRHTDTLTYDRNVFKPHWLLLSLTSPSPLMCIQIFPLDARGKES